MIEISAQALEDHPLAKAPQKLLALDLRIHADPSQKGALISRGIADWKDADADSLVALATWLNGKGEYQRNLDAIPLEKALQTKRSFSATRRCTRRIGSLERDQAITQ